MVENVILRRRINVFKSGLEKLAGLMSQKGVTLRFRGIQCYTDGKTVTLPALDLLESKDAKTEDVEAFISALTGYVEHEVGHVLYTNFRAWKRMGTTCSSQVKGIANAFEDAFVERKMSQLWKGAGETFFKTHEFILSRDSKEYKDYPVMSQVTMLLAYLAKGHAFAHVTKFFDPEIVRWVDQELDKEITAATDIESTSDTVRLAKRVYEKVKAAIDAGKEEEKQQEQEDPGQAPQGKSGGSQGDQDAEDTEEQSPSGGGEEEEGGESFGEEDDDGEDIEQEEEGDGDGDGGSDENVGDDDEEEEEGESGNGSADEEGTEGEAPDEGEAKSEGNSGVEKGTPQEGEEEEEEAGLKDDGSVTDEEFDGDIGNLGSSMKEVFEELMGEPASFHDMPYSSFTTEDDYIGPLKPKWDDEFSHLDESFKRREELAGAVAGPLKSTLSRVLRARGQAYEVRGMDQGRLDRRRLHQLQLGEHGIRPRVFKETMQQETYNVAVLLVVNESGSMSDSVCLPGVPSRYVTKSEIAAATGLVIGDVLDVLDIPFGMFGHTTTDYSIGRKRYERASAVEQLMFSRWGDVRIGWVKEFNQNWRHQRKMIGGLGSYDNTYDAEVVRYATRVLLGQRMVERRIIMMLDDGRPCPNVPAVWEKHSEELKAAVKEGMSAGVELLGIGMGDECVKLYYPDYVVVEDIADLPNVFLTKLGELLGVQRRRASLPSLI